MELRAKRRMDALNEAILQNKILTQRMAMYHASQMGIQLDEPEVGLTDLSDKTLDDNYVRQQFEKNVFRLFRNNTISAQDFIGLVSEEDHARFNTIFPQMLFNLGGQLNVDARSAYNMARTLMMKKAPIEEADKEQPLPSAAKAAQKSYLSDGRAVCPLDGCGGIYKPGGEVQHEKSGKHQNALKTLKFNLANAFPRTPEKKSTGLKDSTVFQEEIMNFFEQGKSKKKKNTV